MELICDGYHIHGAVVRATFSMMGSELHGSHQRFHDGNGNARTERIPSGDRLSG